VAFMRRNEVLQEYRNMRFEKVYTGWKSRELTQDEELSVCDLYKERYSDFNVKHFYKWYTRHHGGQRSYTWVKNTL